MKEILLIMISFFFFVACKKDEINKNNYFTYNGEKNFVTGVALLKIIPPPISSSEFYKIYVFANSLYYDSTNVSSYAGNGSAIEIRINAWSSELTGDYFGFADIFGQGTFDATIKLNCDKSGCGEEYYYYTDCWGQSTECVSPNLTIEKTNNTYIIDAVFFINEQVTELHYEGSLSD